MNIKLEYIWLDGFNKRPKVALTCHCSFLVQIGFTKAWISIPVLVICPVFNNLEVKQKL